MIIPVHDFIPTSFRSYFLVVFSLEFLNVLSPFLPQLLMLTLLLPSWLSRDLTAPDRGRWFFLSL